MQNFLELLNKISVLRLDNIRFIYLISSFTIFLSSKGSITSIELPNRKIALILNKIDLIKPENLFDKASKLAKNINFEKIFMISAKKG